MDAIERSLIEADLARSKAMDRLVVNPDFKLVFLEHFLKSTLNELIYREGSSDGVIKALDTRKGFNDFIYDTIDQGKYAEQKLKEN